VELKSVFSSFINALLFPEHNCLLCEKSIGNARPILSRIHLFSQLKDVCSTCKEQIEVPESPFCYHCHKPLNEAQNRKVAEDDADPLLCSDCKDHWHQDSRMRLNRSAVLYNEIMREYIAFYKYRGKESLAIPFAQLLKVTYAQYFKEEAIDLITFVPLHPSRLQERSFNQAEQLAKRLSYYIGIPAIETLERVKETHKQSKSGKWERLNEMQGAFQIIDRVKEQIQVKTILIIDDIYTTGATLNECAQELMDSGAKKVCSLTLARA